MMTILWSGKRSLECRCDDVAKGEAMTMGQWVEKNTSYYSN